MSSVFVCKSLYYNIYTIGFYQQFNNQAVKASTITLREKGNPPKGSKKFTNKINEQI